MTNIKITREEDFTREALHFYDKYQITREGPGRYFYPTRRVLVFFLLNKIKGKDNSNLLIYDVPNAFLLDPDKIPGMMSFHFYLQFSVNY